jgi:sialate O-acetylesterase
LFTSMISSWRNEWKSEGGQKVLPFYFVQIAPFGYSNLDAAALLRQAQYRVMKKVKNTGMAVTIDLGNMSNIHFTHKKEVGERLALIALAKSYGFNHIIFQGPSCKSVIKVNSEVHLTFDQRLFTIHQNKPGDFEMGYKNPLNDSMIFVQAQSKITGNQVIVWSACVEEPLVVRYAWLDAGEANLVNKTGLPAFPFEKKISLNQLNKN